MKLSYFLFVCAGMISLMAGYFSVVGWAALFAAAFYEVLIAMGALEVGKIASAMWLHRHWGESPLLIRSYMTTAVFALMIITSVGIYGYLSKGHLDQEAPVAVNDIRIQVLEDRVEMASERIAGNRRTLDLIDQKQQEYVARGYVTKSEDYRLSVQDEIQNTQDSILEDTKIIEDTMISLGDLKESNAAAEAKLGPIRYIMEAVGSNDTNQAVRVIIYLIIFVFDPFAISMFIAAQWTHLNETGAASGRVRKDEPEMLIEPMPDPVSASGGSKTVLMEVPNQIKNNKTIRKIFGLNPGNVIR